MRLVSYWAGAALEAGFEDGGRVLSARSVSPGADIPITVRALLQQGVDLREMMSVAETLLKDDDLLAGKLGEIRLGPPVPDPDKVICLGQNYADHVAEMANTRPDVPNLFTKFRNCLIGTGDAIRLPRSSRQVDYEGELAVVIGRTCRQVSEREALEHVAGYTVINDVSARDLQLRTSQYTVGKAADTFGPMGPGIVPAFAIPDPQVLQLATYLNGEQMQSENTSAMLFSVAEAISFISEVITLEPGDILATGTPAGVGYKRVPPRFLQPGDLIEVEVERVGRLSNPVVQG